MEASVYFFDHYRFDSVELQFLQQQDAQLRTSATLRGDIDGLGLDEVHVEDWLRFDGIIVSLDGVATCERCHRTLEFHPRRQMCALA